jgi:hypothetical protein
VLFASGVNLLKTGIMAERLSDLTAETYKTCHEKLFYFGRFFCILVFGLAE